MTNKISMNYYLFNFSPLNFDILFKFNFNFITKLSLIDGLFLNKRFDLLIQFDFMI